MGSAYSGWILDGGREKSTVACGVLIKGKMDFDLRKEGSRRVTT